MSPDTNPGGGGQAKDTDRARIRGNVTESVKQWFLEDPDQAPINAMGFMSLSRNETLLKMMGPIVAEAQTDPSKYWLTRGMSVGYVFHDRQVKALGGQVEVIEDSTAIDVIEEWAGLRNQDLIDYALLEGEDLTQRRLDRGRALGQEIDADLGGIVESVLELPVYGALQQSSRQTFIEGAILVDKMFRKQREKQNPTPQI